MITTDERDRHLERVQALLAKAESTEFADEAEALTAKAYELITTYAIDLALIEEQQGRGDVTALTVDIEPPYSKEKFRLLSAVARGNRCRAVLEGERRATLVGYRSDLDAVELLYTSLRLQAVSTMLAHGSIVEWGTNRTKSFRRSFLAAFAFTIAGRFEEIESKSAAAADRAAPGTVLPVLADRQAVVDSEFEARFPDLTTLRTSISNSEGVLAGRVAGRRADIGTGSIRDRASRGELAV